jgi:plasmid stabilization system protein ParE
MSREFVIRKHAERDIQAVFRWYEKQEPGLGEEFLTSLGDRLETIRDFPESFPVIYPTFAEPLYRGFHTWCST